MIAVEPIAYVRSPRTDVRDDEWGSVTARGPWMPRCDLFLYPTPRAYSQATGQPEISPGISTMSNNGTRILSRRMTLRA